MPDIRITGRPPGVGLFDGYDPSVTPSRVVYEGPPPPHAPDCTQPGAAYVGYRKRSDGRTPGYIFCPNCDGKRRVMDGKPLDSGQQAVIAPVPHTAPVARRRGRPPGTLSVSRDQYETTFRSLRLDYGRDPTQKELADNVDPRVGVRTLQKHLTTYGLNWPIE